MSRSVSSDSATGSPAPSSGSAQSSTDGTFKNTSGSGTAKVKAVKPPNVFSNDGSFLDRIRRSMKEEEDKKKEKEALERKKKFADRFKTRAKRPLPTVEQPSSSDATTPDSDQSPKKKLKLEETSKEDGREDGSAQAEYHRAMESYPGSLKDGGTGVRPLIK